MTSMTVAVTSFFPGATGEIAATAKVVPSPQAPDITERTARSVDSFILFAKANVRRRGIDSRAARRRSVL